ncbi:MAG: glycerol-3-phosphate dehydrogenase subunit GlpB [Ardenticatenaceae bacterium]|nr:glycerol-3-phosphate dehydrogenase subunit GlpB [Ardenticatenaceae bacterium]
MMMNESILVIGAGLAGLTAAWQTAVSGHQTRLIAKGWGTTHWHAGCVDVLGYYGGQLVTSPKEVMGQLVIERPQHPYALVGLDVLAAALAALQTLCAEAGYPLHGSLERNWLLPTAVGAARPTCLAPETMIAGDLSQDTPMLIVGFQQFGDFYAQMAAANLAAQGIPARGIMLDLPTLAERKVLTGVILAQLMEQPAFRAEVARAVKPHMGEAARVGFPAVLGLHQAMSVKADLEGQLQRPIFEIPILPPSVPGMRLHHILRRAIEHNGGRVQEGMLAVGAEMEGGRVTNVYTEAAARQRRHRFDQYVLATGGLLGGGLVTNFEGEVREVIFNLPVSAPSSRLDWFQREFVTKTGHPIYQAGLQVNEQLQPVAENGRPLYNNLYAAGSTLAHCDVLQERSLEGVALATGFKVGMRVIE